MPATVQRTLLGATPPTLWQLIQSWPILWLVPGGVKQAVLLAALDELFAELLGADELFGTLLGANELFATLLAGVEEGCAELLGTIITGVLELLVDALAILTAALDAVLATPGVLLPTAGVLLFGVLLGAWLWTLAAVLEPALKAVLELLLESVPTPIPPSLKVGPPPQAVSKPTKISKKSA